MVWGDRLVRSGWADRLLLISRGRLLLFLLAVLRILPCLAFLPTEKFAREAGLMRSLFRLLKKVL